MNTLNTQDLLKTEAYIDGAWTGSKSRFPVFNPFDGSEIAKVAELGKGETERAIAAAHKAFREWSTRPAIERAKPLCQMADLIEKNVDPLSHLLTHEQGKTLYEAKEEVLLGVQALKWFAEEGCRVHGYTQCDPDPDRSVMTIRQPMGVVGAITPWNFPFYTPVKTLAAVAAGCTLVLKPAEDTPLCALALAYMAEQARLPAGVFNVVTSRKPAEVGEVLATHPLVSKITFTGSTEVGRHLLRLGSATVKNATMELGGNCPFIVFDDADIDKATEGGTGLKFWNAGQCCNGLNRFLVQETVHDAFVEKCVARAKTMTCGSGLTPVNLGPLINPEAKDKVNELVNDAVAKGAKLVLANDLGGLLCSPIVLTNVTDNMRIWREEVFGPVIAVRRFKTEQEAIDMANDTTHGLAAYFYSNDIHRVWRVSRSLQAGTVGVNTTNVYSIMLPFGGWKQSGIGRESGIVEALNEYCELKAISFGRH